MFTTRFSWPLMKKAAAMQLFKVTLTANIGKRPPAPKAASLSKAKPLSFTPFTFTTLEPTNTKKWATMKKRPAFCCLAGATTRSAAITKAIPWPPSLTVKRVTAFT